MVLVGKPAPSPNFSALVGHILAMKQPNTVSSGVRYVHRCRHCNRGNVRMTGGNSASTWATLRRVKAVHVTDKTRLDAACCGQRPMGMRKQPDAKKSGDGGNAGL